MKYIKRHRLVEGRSESIELEEAVKFFKQRCTQYNPKLSIIYRGIKDASELKDNYSIVKPSEHTREAAYTNTTYLNIIDNLDSWSEYPKRRKSIICSTSRDVSKSFGKVHVVIPTDNAFFGVCPSYDFQACFRKFSLKFGIPLYKISDLLDYNRNYSYSLEEFKSKMIAKEYNTNELSYEYKKYASDNNITPEETLKDMFEYMSPVFNEFRTFKYDGETDISNIEHITLMDSNEVWTSDDCLIVNATYYKTFLRELGIDEEFVSNLLV